MTVFERLRMPSLGGANGWLNSEPLGPAELRGHIVLVDFWTLTCINWLRTEPYIRAWSQAYRDDGLIVIGVHTPEFSFEHELDRVRQATKEMAISYPVAADNDYAIWSAFDNNYWPALYFVDADGVIRDHHFGEGRYKESERVIQRLLGIERDLMRGLVTLHLKLRHRSGGEAQPFRCSLEPQLASFGVVAVADVVAHREREAVPVEVVGVLDHEFADCAEVALDPVQVAGVGRCRDELDVAALGPRADRGLPVAGEVGLDPVDEDLGRVGEPDVAHEGERRVAVAARPQPCAQVVGVDVERADQVADTVAAAIGGAVPLGTAALRPAAAVVGTEADRPHLVEADYDAVLGLAAVQLEHPRRPGLVVGVGARLPRTRPLERQAGLGQDPRQMRSRDGDPFAAEMLGQLRETPARQRHPEGIGTGAGDRDDPLLVVSRDPAGSPAPKTRAQRVEAVPVELVDDLAHVRLVSHPHLRDLGRAHLGRRGEQDHRPLPGRAVLGLLREPLQPLPLGRGERPHEHRRGTHRHLLRSHASRFDTRARGPATFPVKRFERRH